MSKKQFNRDVSPFAEENRRTASILRTSMNINDLASTLSRLEGKVLTVLEASIANPEQLKALKSVMRSTLWESYEKVFAWGEQCIVVIENDKKKGVSGTGSVSAKPPFPFPSEFPPTIWTETDSSSSFENPPTVA